MLGILPGASLAGCLYFLHNNRNHSCPLLSPYSTPLYTNPHSLPSMDETLREAGWKAQGHRASMEGAMPPSQTNLSERPNLSPYLVPYAAPTTTLWDGCERKANWVLTRLNYGSRSFQQSIRGAWEFSPGPVLPRHWTNRRVTKRGTLVGVEEQG